MYFAILSLLVFASAPWRQDAKQDDLLDRINDLEKKVQDLEKRQAQTTSANPATVFNPAITVVGNFLWRLDNDDVLTEQGDAIDDTANLRELEFDLRAAVDPYADGVAILALEAEIPGEYEATLEELLINIKSLPLPFWEEPPLGTKLKIGRMRTEFGRNNRMHLHDLPQSNRPLAVEAFLGEEGHVTNGASAQCFLPSPGDTALEFTFQALQGGGIAVADDRNHPAYLANARWFVPLGDEHSFDVSLIGFYGTNDPDGHRQSRVVSVDFLYRWKPLRQGGARSVVVGGQLFKALDHEFGFEVDTDSDGIPDTATHATMEPLGWCAWGQVQLDARLYAGVRYDDAEFMSDDSRDRRRVQPYLSWYLSEFFRARVSYEHTWSDDDAEDGLDTVLFELNIVFGAHPAEPFWVNR